MKRKRKRQELEKIVAAAESRVCVSCGASSTTNHLRSNRNKYRFNANLDDGVCGHAFCPDCIQTNLYQANRNFFPCPVPGCGVKVRDGTLHEFANRSLEELQAERDRAARQRVMKVFNQAPEDYDSVEELNKDLEHSEDLIYMLVHGNKGARDAAEQQLQEYKQKYEREIALSESKKSEREQKRRQQVEEEQEQREKARQDAREQDERKKRDLEQATRDINASSMQERTSMPVSLFRLGRQSPRPKPGRSQNMKKQYIIKGRVLFGFKESDKNQLRHAGGVTKLKSKFTNTTLWELQSALC